ncbi:MAG: SpoIIE family protein phosphatase [Actinomycetales bacterium]|nr:SpoIIE family protein phosphatase [Actinomycetales bacterium]
MTLRLRLLLFLGIVTAVTVSVAIWEVRAYSAAKSQVGMFLPQEDQLLKVGNQLVQVILASAIIDFLILTTATIFAHFWVIKPLYQMRNDLEKISEGHLNVSIRASGPKEIRQTAQSAERMKKSLVHQIELTKSAELSLESNASMTNEVRLALVPKFRRKDIYPLDVYDYSLANQGVTSGDWWDIFTNEYAHYLVQVDVEGHDDASAIAGLQSKAIFASNVAAGVEMHQIVKAISDILVPDDAGAFPKFSTAFVIEIPRDPKLPVCWLSAGHPPAILVSAEGTHSLLNSSGPMLAGFGQVWDIRQFFLEPGMKLIVASDGLHELRSSSEKNFFEVEKIISAIVSAGPNADVKETVNSIVADMKNFAPEVDFENWARQDDITILAISRGVE